MFDVLMTWHEVNGYVETLEQLRPGSRWEIFAAPGYRINTTGRAFHCCESSERADYEAGGCVFVPRFHDAHVSAFKRARRNRINRVWRKERDAAMRSLGLKKVRGALGGTYWE